MKIKTVCQLSRHIIKCCFLIGIIGLSDLSAQVSYQIIPHIGAGAITARTSESELKKIYGAKNVQSAEIPLGEGETEAGTVIYPNDPSRKIEITWKDLEKKRFPKFIQLTGDKSLWRTRHGISLGTRLKELERINQKPFTLAGFGWDYGGTVYSWKNGKLAKEFEKGGRILLRLSDDTGHKVTGKDYDKVQGDIEFSSGNRIMQRINPKIYQIIIEFPGSN